jgi:hypothetical protein
MILNDHYLKYQYGNWLTGKLSDLAGLVVLPVFLTALFPRHQKWMLLIAAVFFIWWKTALSQPFFDLVQKQWHLHIPRTIDHTDLFALAVLPLVLYMKPLSFYPSLLFNSFRLFSGLVALAGLCATSPPRYYQGGDRDALFVHRRLKTSSSEDQVIRLLHQAGIGAERDTASFKNITYQNIYLEKQDSSGVKLIRANQVFGLQVYEKLDPPKGAYIIPIMAFGADTLRDVRFYYADWGKRKKQIEISSFKYSNLHQWGDPVEVNKATKKFGKLIRKRLKAVLK